MECRAFFSGHIFIIGIFWIDCVEFGSTADAAAVSEYCGYFELGSPDSIDTVAFGVYSNVFTLIGTDAIVFIGICYASL